MTKSYPRLKYSKRHYNKKAAPKEAAEFEFKVVLV
jgi:hypothetical protein